MSLHSYNFGLKTSGKGEIFESFSWVTSGASGAVGAIRQASANLVASVVLSATATYTVTLNSPLPPTLVAVIPEISCSAANSAGLRVRYQTGSYDPVAGTFVLFVTDHIGTTATVPADTDRISVMLSFEQYTNMPA